MENIALDWKDSNFKQSKLFVHCKNLLNHIDSAKNQLQTRFIELQNHESEIGSLQTQVEAKSSQLHEIERVIEVKSKEVESSEERLCSLQLLIEEQNEELALKEKRFSEVQRMVVEKEREYDSVENRVEKERSRLNWFEDKSKLVESKEQELKGVERDIELKEGQLNEIVGLIEKQKKDSCLEEEKIKAAKRSVDEWEKEMRLKEENLSSIQKSIVECNKTIESREKILREMDLKVKDFCVYKKSMEEWCYNLEMKEKQFESKVEELHRRINQSLSEVQLKEKHFCSLELLIQEREKQLGSQEQSLQECSNGVEMKERQLNQRAKELELKQLDSVPKSTAYACASVITLPSTPSNPSNMNGGGRGLQLLTSENLNKIDLLCSQISAHLEASSDPAELVLDAMEGFYPSNLAVDNMKFHLELRVIRRSCVLLLQELKILSPQISPQVREEATQLAAEWKSKMKVEAENVLEILGILWLLTAFDLTSTYDAKELRSLQKNLVAIVSREHDVSQAHGITAIVPGSTLSFPINIQESEVSPESNVATTPCLNVQPSTTTDAWDSQGCPNENISGSQSVQNDSTLSLTIKIPESESSSPERNVDTIPCPNVQPSTTADARDLQGCPHENLSGSQSAQNDILDALLVSHDPEKLALTLMKHFLDEYWRKGGLEETLIMKNSALLKDLTEVLPHVGSHVRKEAIELALNWASKLSRNADNSLEILCFLQFIATFGLLSTFNADEIVNLPEVVSQHKQAPELRQTLGFADTIPDLVRNLIARKQLILAVRFICTFKLHDMFPKPALLLKGYVDDGRNSHWKFWRETQSPDEKEKALDEEIADLRAVIQCIKDCSLESEYPSKNIGIQIAHLENLKKTWRQFGRPNAFQQELVSQKKRRTRTSDPKSQPPKKRQAKTAATPRASSTLLPHNSPPVLSSSSHLQKNYANSVVMQSSSAARVHGNFRPPARFGMAANNPVNASILSGFHFQTVVLQPSHRSSPRPLRTNPNQTL